MRELLPPSTGLAGKLGAISRSPVLAAMWCGFKNHCPRCGQGTWRVGYLTVTPRCPACGEQLGHIRADDGPAYFTLLIAVHVIVPAALIAEQHWHPPLVPMMVIAVLAMCALIGVLLPRVKGAMVGLMWQLGLNGRERQGNLDLHG